MSGDEGAAWLLADALAKGPLLTQACRAAHEHNAIACYEKRYGVILTEQPRDVHVIRDSDRPLYASLDFSDDPLDVVLADEALAEAMSGEDEDRRVA
jgi:hypothetical protein